MTYEEWIKANVKDDGYGKCESIVKQMSKAFPKLEVRKGFFHSCLWGQRGHWWLRTPDGDIVDPTGLQHPDGMLFPILVEKYEDLTDLSDEAMVDRVPSGVCMDCGNPVYCGNTFCNEECEAKTMAYLGLEKTEDGHWRNK